MRFLSGRGGSRSPARDRACRRIRQEPSVLYILAAILDDELRRFKTIANSDFFKFLHLVVLFYEDFYFLAGALSRKSCA